MPLTIAERDHLRELEERQKLESPEFMMRLARTHVACAQFHLGKAIEFYFREFNRPIGVLIYRIIRTLRPWSVRENEEAPL